MEQLLTDEKQEPVLLAKSEIATKRRRTMSESAVAGIKHAHKMHAEYGIERQKLKPLKTKINKDLDAFAKKSVKSGKPIELDKLQSKYDSIFTLDAVHDDKKVDVPVSEPVRVPKRVTSYQMNQYQAPQQPQSGFIFL